MSQIVGHISQVIGPVVDVYFEGTEAEMMLPSIHDALEIKRSNGKRLIVEVQQHIGENTVRTVAMDSTDGLQRGMTVHPLGGPITMPIGTQIKGRLMNVVGDSIDGMKELDRTGAYPIHRDPPKFEDLTTVQEVLYTGIKVIDLLEPYSKGGKIGLFGGAGVGKTCITAWSTPKARACRLPSAWPALCPSRIPRSSSAPRTAAKPCAKSRSTCLAVCTRAKSRSTITTAPPACWRVCLPRVTAAWAA